MIVFNAGSEHDIDAVFAALGRQRITALLIVADPFFTSRHAQLAELTARHRVPAIYATRDFTDSGGLVATEAESRTDIVRPEFTSARS